MQVRVAQSVEHRTTAVRAVNSNPTVGKNFSFCNLSLSTRTWYVDWSTQMKLSMIFITVGFEPATSGLQSQCVPN